MLRVGDWKGVSITFVLDVNMIELVDVVGISKKGQVTISKHLRDKYGIKDKVVMAEREQGIMLQPLLTPSDELGSLKEVFKRKTARQLLNEARKEEFAEDSTRVR